MHKNAKDITGQKFGRLLVVSRAGISKDRNVKWNCICNCGKTAIARGKDLRSGHTESCGCIAKQHTIGDRTRTHGKSKTKIYKTWSRMVDRCNDPKDRAFTRYGGRGIKVCKRWLNFEKFYEDMGDKPSPKHSIERIDNDGPYSPKNCKWANFYEQARNKRSNRIIEYNGKKQCLADWAKNMGLTSGGLFARLTKMSVTEAITQKHRYWKSALKKKKLQAAFSEVGE